MYFEVDTTLDCRSRKGRGTRTTKFHEEFGYEVLVSNAAVSGGKFAFAPVAYDPMSVTTEPDTMDVHQAMRQDDAKSFLDAAQEEFQICWSGKSSKQFRHILSKKG
jgi:hypothetical protein